MRDGDFIKTAYQKRQKSLQKAGFFIANKAGRLQVKLCRL